MQAGIKNPIPKNPQIFSIVLLAEIALTLRLKIPKRIKKVTVLRPRVTKNLKIPTNHLVD